MIAKLHGIIDTIGEDSCIIDVNGVGYLVSASAKTLAKLNVGAEASLLTVMTVMFSFLYAALRVSLRPITYASPSPW